jgi:hypothetical protein
MAGGMVTWPLVVIFMEKQLPVDEAGVNPRVPGRGEQSRWKSPSCCLNRPTQPAHVPAAPILTREFDTGTNLLLITSVAGQNVVQPPRGDLLNPDVIFSDPGDITVTVRGTNVPNGSVVRLRLTTATGIITPPNTALTNGIATFTLTVPRGHGTIQAFADFMLTGP